MKKKISVREYLHSINVIGDDVDVYVDGIDGYAVCPPVCFTKAGEDYYKDVLDNPDLYMDGNCICSDNDDDYDVLEEDGRSGLLEKAYGMLAALAGYCPASEFDKYFKNGNGMEKIEFDCDEIRERLTDGIMNLLDLFPNKETQTYDFNKGFKNEEDFEGIESIPRIYQICDIYEEGFAVTTERFIISLSRCEAENTFLAYLGKEPHATIVDGRSLSIDTLGQIYLSVWTIAKKEGLI